MSRKHNNGWFAVSREIFEHPVVGAGKLGQYSPMEAWCWLIERAARKPYTLTHKGEMIDLQVGELIISNQLELARKWSWSRSMLRAFFERTAREQMTTIAATNTASKVRLLNYAHWQHLELITTSEQTANEQGAATIYKEGQEQEQKESSADALAAFNAFNSMAAKLLLPQASKLTPARKRKLLLRLREHGGIAAWHRALANLAASRFLCGDNSRAWKADLDFILQPSSFVKLLEGAYTHGAPQAKQLVNHRAIATIRDTSESFEAYKQRMVAEGKVDAKG